MVLPCIWLHDLNFTARRKSDFFLYNINVPVSWTPPPGEAASLPPPQPSRILTLVDFQVLSSEKNHKIVFGKWLL